MTPAHKHPLIEADDNSLRLNLWWLAAAALGLLIPIIGFTITAYYWQPVYAWRWMLTFLVIIIYILAVLKNGLRSNYRVNDPRLLPGLGIGNWITFLRSILVATLAGFFFLPWPEATGKFGWLVWLPGAIYTSAAILDYFDGFAARLSDHQTRLGQEFDTLVDALGLLVGILVAIKIGQLPIIYLCVGLAYYLFQLGTWYRRKYSKPLIELIPHPRARLMAGLQMGFVSMALFPILRPPVTTLAAYIFMIPFMVVFLRDWLVICGHIATGSCQVANWEIKVYRLFTGWAPFFLRMFIIIVGIAVAYETIFLAFAPHDKTAPAVFFLQAATLYIVVIGLIILVGLGLCGRLSAILLSVITGYLILSGGHGSGFYALFLAACCLAITGSGFFSIWQPEEKIIRGNRYPDDCFSDLGYRV